MRQGDLQTLSQQVRDRVARLAAERVVAPFVGAQDADAEEVARYLREAIAEAFAQIQREQPQDWGRQLDESIKKGVASALGDLRKEVNAAITEAQGELKQEIAKLAERSEALQGAPPDSLEALPAELRSILSEAGEELRQSLGEKGEVAASPEAIATLREELRAQLAQTSEDLRQALREEFERLAVEAERDDEAAGQVIDPEALGKLVEEAVERALAEKSVEAEVKTAVAEALSGIQGDLKKSFGKALADAPELGREQLVKEIHDLIEPVSERASQMTEAVEAIRRELRGDAERDELLTAVLSEQIAERISIEVKRTLEGSSMRLAHQINAADYEPQWRRRALFGLLVVLLIVAAFVVGIFTAEQVAMLWRLEGGS